jgi:hypothetical protein
MLEKVKDSTRHLKNGKVVKVKNHTRNVKGKGNTNVVQHRRAGRTKTDALKNTSHAGDEFLRKKEINARGETVEHNDEDNSTTWTMPTKRDDMPEAEKKAKAQKIAHHKAAIAKNEKNLTNLVREHEKATKAGNKEFAAKTAEKMRGVQDMLDRSARLLAKHEGKPAPKPRFAPVNDSANTSDNVTKTGTVVGGPKQPAKVRVPVPKAFKDNEQQRVSAKTPMLDKLDGITPKSEPANKPSGKNAKPKDPGAAAKPVKANEESEFSKSMKSWQERNLKRGKPNYNASNKDQKSTKSNVKRVFGAKKKKGQKPLKEVLAKISQNYNING